ncbi:MAG: dihydroorotate dehydrogenase-like protein [Candidatus Marinimicrobia bacterium]|nr:dihydroorotate dehydrogenase-like protein [Candidatus Neomarinimicrobiota bacterium]MCF7829255.1 dihydroorotate dehydrogenase-like protein [Candidatus Neomarinimicrobiota bacterium]MCF7881092.1 dihydroorotate dehydrogenase-like protein [Candidatus Neomarinimicrobiota bacterium]
MDLTTSYLGLDLKNPIVPSASPLSEKIDNIKAMEDNGAAAVVLYSLFEEEIEHEELELHFHTTRGTEVFSEALSYYPEHENYLTGPDTYLEHIRKAKEAVDIPIIASLNGVTKGGWLKYAQEMEEAGADALELNIYFLATDPEVSAQDIEDNYIDILQEVKHNVDIPVAVKLSPFFSSMAEMAHRLDMGGADSLVLFNRFYQPDIDLEKLDIRPNVLLSSPMDLRLPLRWIGILRDQVKLDLAATGGIHTAEDAIKVLMVGANVAMMASALLKHGISRIKSVLVDMEHWMEVYEYESVRQLQGSMSHKSVKNPADFERANYIKALQSYDMSGIV